MNGRTEEQVEKAVWPDGDRGPKWLWPCEHGDWLHALVESPPVPPHHKCAECGVEPLPILPASICEELAETLQQLLTASEPYVERAAPHERMDGEWNAIYDQLAAARYSTERVLDHYRSTTATHGGSDGE